MFFFQTLSAIRLSWINGNSGKGPINGYYIESRPKGKKNLAYVPPNFRSFSCKFSRLNDVAIINDLAIFHLQLIINIEITNYYNSRIKVQLINGFCFNVAAFALQQERIGNCVSSSHLSWCSLQPRVWIGVTCPFY